MKKGKRHFKFFQYVGDTPIVSIKFRIMTVFVVMLLLSTFSTNLISVALSQKKIFQLSNIVLVDKLSEIFNIATSQKQIAAFSQNPEASILTMQESARKGFTADEPNGIAMGINPDRSLLFMVSANQDLNWKKFTDKEAFKIMESSYGKQGSLQFTGEDGEKYFAVFKYHDEWQTYLVRGNRIVDTNKIMYRIMGVIIILIIVMAVFFIFMGTKILEGLLANIRKFTHQMYDMQQTQTMRPLNTEGCPNDDITYLAANFNSLSSTVDNLLSIFQKFVPKNVVRKAHEEQSIKLEGKQRELTILFSDIKSFTYRTEILGNDIIGLLNVHYDSVIKRVGDHNGIIGSIIGDAILASYGIEDDSRTNKSYDAIKSAWEITGVTAELRNKMKIRREVLEKTRPLTENEERVYNAVMLDVGVGIDGGTVFYGNIGSFERMANTVIGDNVNSASRLEGLTREYKLPVIVSEYIREETLTDYEAKARYVFYEIDTVQVKGKTEGVKIYFPLDKDCPSPDWSYNLLHEKFDVFEEGLKAYYKGDWKTARAKFKAADMSVAKVFLERMGMKSAPADWSGIWTMKTK
ncbi:MAG: adenylate/guanylate cyclase domain-containing protein [Treponema sp.]|nr:adenylate/guanylate cyclase domain-containing protein [Treponema sp.]